MWCLAIGWCFVAPKMAWGEARRGSISAVICDRGATKPQAIFGATLRAAVLLASRVVARSLQTTEGYARRSRLAGGQNPLLRNTSYGRDTTLAEPRRAAQCCEQILPALGACQPQNSLTDSLGRILSRKPKSFESALRFLSLLLFSSQQGTKITKSKGIGLGIVSL